jgi:3-isopropylmalate/(R)-2-methylmalate dehydratase small subunit
MKQRIISRVSGRGLPLRGDDIDTDRIIPARYLRCVTFDGLGDHVFEDDRKSAGGTPHPFDKECHRGASILVVNRNFGCGSSREHAPQGLLRWGIRGLVGESFAEIFFGNCVSLGIPCVRLEPSEVEEIQSALETEPATQLTLDLEGGTVDTSTSGARASGKKYAARLPEAVRRSFLNGDWDATGLLVAEPEDIHAVARSLPYVGGF